MKFPNERFSAPQEAHEKTGPSETECLCTSLQRRDLVCDASLHLALVVTRNRVGDGADGGQTTPMAHVPLALGRPCLGECEVQ